MKCTHCKKEWRYKGNAIYFISCPNCKKRIKILDDENNDYKKTYL